MSTNFELRNVERFTRFIIGFGIVLSILIVPLTAEGIFAACALAIYPLITSLVALDPIFYAVEKIVIKSPVTMNRKMEMAL